MSYARKVDANQAQIVAELRQRGYLVKDLRKAGDGVPDLLVCRPGGPLYALEIKTKTGKLTPKQAGLIGMGWRILICRSAEEVLEQMR